MGYALANSVIVSESGRPLCTDGDMQVPDELAADEAIELFRTS